MLQERMLTLTEVAKFLGLDEQKVKELVKSGQIPYYKIGGTFIRFKQSQIEQIKTNLLANLDLKPYQEKQKSQRPSSPISPAASLKEKLMDFWHFYDFYIISALTAGIILVIIFRNIR